MPKELPPRNKSSGCGEYALFRKEMKGRYPLEKERTSKFDESNPEEG
jgi:hypothetical protein